MKKALAIAFITLICSMFLQTAGSHATEPGSIVFPPPEVYGVKEEKIQFLVNGSKVVDTLATPVGKGPAPVILLLHGHTGNRDEANIPKYGEGIFKHAAKLWAQSGYASLRIDFRGSGESETAWAETTFSRQTEDAVQAVSYLRSSPSVDGKRIAVAGWSQGGMIAAALAARTKGLRGVGLWNAVINPSLTFEGWYSNKNVKLGLPNADGPQVADDKRVGNTGLNGAFFKELYTFHPLAEIAQYSGPLFVAVGTKDFSVGPQPETGKLFLKAHSGSEELMVRDMDHSFNIGKGSALVDEMINATLTYFRQYLDLDDILL
ncbi:alpha/beta hydrolase family protein [Candidatus Phyllobacterium onerii]|uniref:alpha/beta hydrolase family protein n=1 Tax=Candidatus Phyllobacterium onerii TaxID=3020828 RepID=UPI002331522F|nr:alpha/beta fold hydrolase [Phyllobacterium sp. IY22]